MRLPHPRLHLRTLLTAVAVAGLVLGVWTMWKRREYCLARAQTLEKTAAQRSTIADLHDRVSEIYGTYRDSNDRVSPQPVASEPTAAAWEAALLVWADRWREREDRQRANSAKEAAKARSEINSLKRLAARYRHVARYPWLPLPREPE